MFAAYVDCAGFGFCGGADNIFYCLAQDVEGTVGSCAIFPAEVVVDGGTAAGFGLDEIGGFGSDF